VDNNEVRKLLTVSGACHGVELKLMEDTCGFGAVVVNSKMMKTVQLANLGDVGAKFNWDTALCKNISQSHPNRAQFQLMRTYILRLRSTPTLLITIFVSIRYDATSKVVNHSISTSSENASINQKILSKRYDSKPLSEHPFPKKYQLRTPQQNLGK